MKDPAGGDGYVCDRCGGDVGNASVLDCASMTVLEDTRDLVYLHFCLKVDATHEGCAARVLTPTTMTALTVARGGDELEPWLPPADG